MPARSRSAMPACSPAGAFTAGILFKELNAPFWITLPAAALVGALLGVIFGLPSLRLRGLYLAVSTLALHFVVVYLGGEYESQARLFDRHHDRSADHRRLHDLQSARLVLRAARLRRRGAADLPQPAAQPHRPRLARHPRQRDRRRGARHRRRRLQAAGLRDLVRDGARSPARCSPITAASCRSRRSRCSSRSSMSR